MRQTSGLANHGYVGSECGSVGFEVLISGSGVYKERRATRIQSNPLGAASSRTDVAHAKPVTARRRSATG